MLRHPHVGREQLVAFQNERLRRLVEHAYRNVAYYRGLFDRHELKPQDIRTVQDLAAVPITSRSDLQGLPVEEIVARNVEPGLSNHSCFKWVIREAIYCAPDLAGGAPAWGVPVACAPVAGSPSERQALLCDGTAESPTQDHQIVQRILATFGIARQMVVNCLQSPEEIVRALHQFRPAVVSGYPGVLARIAQTVSSDELRLLRLRFVSTGGEVLTPLMRQQIQDGFSVPVYDTYGSIEFNLLAWECRATGSITRATTG